MNCKRLAQQSRQKWFLEKWNNCFVTDSIKQSPWNATSSSPSQESARILWIPMVHYRYHKTQSPLIVWARSIQSASSNPISLRCIQISSSHLSLGLPNGYFLQCSPWKPCMDFSFPPTRHVPRPSHPTIIVSDASRSSNHCSFLQSSVTSSLSRPRVFLSTKCPSPPAYRTHLVQRDTALL